VAQLAAENDIAQCQVKTKPDQELALDAIERKVGSLRWRLRS